IPKHSCSSARLGRPMSWMISPALDRCLIPEEGERQELARFGQALEALDRYEAVALGQLSLQLGGERQIGILLTLGRPDLEDDRDHLRTGEPCGAEASFRNIRSSRRMN